MEKCLVTKLKGAAVSETPLPKYDTITLDYMGEWLGSNENSAYLEIETGDEGCVVTAKALFHVDSLSNEGVTEYEVVPNTYKKIYIKASEAGISNVDEFLTLTGGIYTLKKLAQVGEGNACFDFAPTNYNGLKSLKYNDNICVLSLTLTASPNDGKYYLKSSDIPTSVQYISIVHKAGSTINVESPIDSLYLYSAACGVGYNLPRIITSPDVFAMDNLIIFSSRISGDIALLPKNTRLLKYPTSVLEGNIEDYLANVRAAGRTSGNLTFWKAKASWNNVKYGGIPLPQTTEVQALANSGLPITVYWDANTSYLSATTPSDYSTLLNKDDIEDFVPFE